jgi:hypothetical protein
MRAFHFPSQGLAEPTPKLAEILPYLPNFAQISAQKTNHGLNLGQIGRNSAKIRGGN